MQALSELHGATNLNVIQHQVDGLQTLIREMYATVDFAIVQFRSSQIGRPRRELKMCELVDAIAEVCAL